MATLMAWFAGQIVFDKTTATILIIGFFNGIGAFCHWKATDISMSRTYLAVFFDDIIAMALAYSILSEGQFLNVSSATGITVCLLTVIFLSVIKYRKDVTAGVNDKSGELNFLLYVGIYSIIWGIAMFSIRLYGSEGLSPFRFIWCWYSGAFVAAVAIFLCYTDKKSPNQKMARMEVLQALSLGGCIMTALALSYWCLSLKPQIKLQPLFLVTEMTVPVFIGLYMFKETLVRLEKFLFVLAISSGLLVAFNI